jgi:hypothetical protein
MRTHFAPLSSAPLLAPLVINDAERQEERNDPEGERLGIERPVFGDDGI